MKKMVWGFLNTLFWVFFAQQAFSCNGTLIFGSSSLSNSCRSEPDASGNFELSLSFSTISQIIQTVEVRDDDRTVTNLRRLRSQLSIAEGASITFPSDNGNCNFSLESGVTYSILPETSCRAIKAHIFLQVSLLMDQLASAALSDFGEVRSTRNLALFFDLAEYQHLSEEKAVEALFELSSGNLVHSTSERFADAAFVAAVRRDEWIQTPQVLLSSNASAEAINYYATDTNGNVAVVSVDAGWLTNSDQTRSIFPGSLGTSAALIAGENYLIEQFDYEGPLPTDPKSLPRLTTMFVLDDGGVPRPINANQSGVITAIDFQNELERLLYQGYELGGENNLPPEVRPHLMVQTLE